MMEKSYFVYILSDKNNKKVYIGVTDDLKRRVYEHKLETMDGYTKRFHIHKLVYYEIYRDILRAIAREKQLKKWTRVKKDALVESKNPDMHDLWDKL